MQANENGEVWKGLVAGLAAGLVASWTMNQFQSAWTRIAKGFERPHGAQSMQPVVGANPDSSQALTANQSAEPANKSKEKEEDNATVKAAQAISEGIFDHKLTKSEKEPAGAAVHYAFGAASGGLYGAMAEVAPQITAGAGVPFGAVFWLVADEGAVPLLGLAKGPTEYPLSTHAYALASHLVYGLTTELSRRAVRQVL